MTAVTGLLYTYSITKSLNTIRGYFIVILHVMRLQHRSLTGSIPRGYGPLNTPVTFGSRVRKPFPLTSWTLFGEDETTIVSWKQNIWLFHKLSWMFCVCHWDTLTSTHSLWTWLWRSIQNQRCSWIWRNSHCISGRYKQRKGPSLGWCNDLQKKCSRSGQQIIQLQVSLIRKTGTLR